MHPRLIALDLDGTLLDAGGRVSGRTIAAVRAVRAAGVHVCLATGRPLGLAALTVAELRGGADHVVAMNGAVVCDFPAGEPQGRVLRRVGLDGPATRSLVTRLRAHDETLGFALGNEQEFVHEPGFSVLISVPVGGRVVDDALELDGDEIDKLLVFGADETTTALVRRLRPLVPEELAIGHLGMAGIAEIGPHGIDKAAGLQWLCDHLGVAAADVVAFGDDLNDMTMLAWAGRGIAMENAASDLRRIADEIAPSNLDDGVAVVLERILSTRVG